MAFLDYIWLVRLIIEILRVISEFDNGEKEKIAKLARDMHNSSTA